MAQKLNKYYLTHFLWVKALEAAELDALLTRVSQLPDALQSSEGLTWGGFQDASFTW